MEKYLVIGAVIADRFIGDPRTSLHPVAMIGNLISILERLLLKPDYSSSRKKTAGALLVVGVLGIVYGLVWLVMFLFYSIHSAVALIGGIVLLSFTISPRSLAEAGQEIKGYLLAGNMVEARYKVGWIVGRDTERLDTGEVTRATVETIAENIVDGIISPLFYAAIGGVPLAFLYRAVNTLDSMVGYKNDKYRDFGMVAARVDDIFNYIPARVTGPLIVIAAFILRYDAYGAARSIRHDAAKHPSPNSGIAEAGVAGALGVRLGGLNYYGGVSSHRAYMGEAKNQLTPRHIDQAIRIMYLVTVLFAVLCFGLQRFGVAWLPVGW
ncbi:MAG TPA: adenosylcobinamide-phosphate synthase CbiB [Methylomusa anaerophila]|uniref:Cobalamin biosynthesis protein CobD n=1 Tax=Methylomusa anaerophila TaxID=1930071 RepID=A0A348AQD6_9FIRM|nr:adenosylcobinamide-phosphate synthase CbiB [Methylomusa anaerophila]BBB93284.1 cobalamin biosynthesis protein [Methylomusa anaerophila]HML86885.1 adenosylcobinamide-phosphate synthase CbiB [Methylomusa anaerophila]